jgi:hypothetical protein
MPDEWAYRAGKHYKIPAYVAGPFIEGLRERAGGEIRPQDVVEAARPPTSIIHAMFTWDDQKAAIEFRLHEAKKIITAIVKVRRPPDRPPVVVHCYVGVGRPKTGSRYVLLEDALADRELRAQLFHEILYTIRGWRRRVSEIFGDDDPSLRHFDTIRRDFEERLNRP